MDKSETDEINSTEDESRYSADSLVVQKLTTGFLSIFKPHLLHVKSLLDELTQKQGSLIVELQNENLKFSVTESSNELQEMLLMVKHYQVKLATIKKTMLALHEKSTKLKKRALKLQQIKQKEALNRQMQLQREQELIGKPQSSRNTNNPQNI